MLGGAACALIGLGAVALLFDVVDPWLAGAAVVAGVLGGVATVEAWHHSVPVPRSEGRRRAMRSLATSLVLALGATAAIVAGASVPLVAAAFTAAAVVSALPDVVRSLRQARRTPADSR